MGKMRLGALLAILLLVARPMGFSSKAKLDDLGSNETIDGILEDLETHDKYKNKGGIEGASLYRYYRQIIKQNKVEALMINPYNGILFYGKIVLDFNERDELKDKLTEWYKKTVKTRKAIDETEETRKQYKKLYHEYGKYIVTELIELKEELSSSSQSLLVELNEAIGEESGDLIATWYGYLKDLNIGVKKGLKEKLKQMVKDDIIMFVEPYLDPKELGNELYLLIVIRDKDNYQEYSEQGFHIVDTFTVNEQYLPKNMEETYNRAFLSKYTMADSEIKLESIPLRGDLKKYY